MATSVPFGLGCFFLSFALAVVRRPLFCPELLLDAKPECWGVYYPRTPEL